MQFADEEHVLTTAAVATMVFPVEGTVKDIAVGPSIGAVDTPPLGTKSCLWPSMVTLSARAMPVVFFLRVLEKSAGLAQAAST